MNDEIIEPIRVFREEFARAHGYDVRAMGATLREQQAKSGRTVVHLPPRRPAGWSMPAPAAAPAAPEPTADTVTAHV